MTEQLRTAEKVCAHHPDDVQASIVLGLNDIWHCNILKNISPKFNVVT